MKTHLASLINALSLILLSSWGYLASETPSVTALIPAIIGVLLLFFIKGLKSEKKVPAHIAVLLTILVFVGLIMPLLGALKRNDASALLRVSIMLTTTLIAIISFIQSFVRARKNT